MGRINWGRIILCGLVASLVWGVPSAVLVHRVGADWQIAVHAGRPAPTEGRLFFVVLVLTNLLTGIWCMWLYAAIRPRYGPGPKTAALAGFALWVVFGMAHVIWAVFAVLPPHVLGPLEAAHLPAYIVGAVVGAWLYKE